MSRPITTELVLLAIHKAPLIPLADVCERYLSLTFEGARRKASNHDLPFPAFLIEPANPKSGYMVRATDLASFIDAAATAGVKSWEKSQV